MTEVIRIDDRDGVRLVTWNRPDALNAMSLELWDGTRDAIASATEDDVGCIVLTGTGRAFTVGQDLAEFAHPGQADERRGLRGLLRAVAEVEVPLLAAVNGMAVGFGATILPWWCWPAPRRAAWCRSSPSASPPRREAAPAWST
jgi:enoyl-CoA hydratase/carnithine racemase